MIECNAGSFEVLGAIRNIFFGKSFKCIHKSQLGSWQSSWGQSFDSIKATNERSNECSKSQTDSRTNRVIGTGCIASCQPFIKRWAIPR